MGICQPPRLNIRYRAASVAKAHALGREHSDPNGNNWSSRQGNECNAMLRQLTRRPGTLTTLYPSGCRGDFCDLGRMYTGAPVWCAHQQFMESAEATHENGCVGWGLSGVGDLRSCLQLGASFCREPDGLTNLRVGDSTVPPYRVPGPFLRTGPGVASYAAVNVFATRYGQARFAAMCQGLQLTNSDAMTPKYHPAAGA